MSDVPAAAVKALRERTGAGMMDCKAALEEARGDVQGALEILRIRGQAKAARRSERTAAEGMIAHYVHANGQIGVLVEVNCETDFVARSDEFQALAHEVALHIAATAPRWVSEQDVPGEAKQAERAIFERQASDRPPEVRSRVAEGKLQKWLEEAVLLSQEHVNGDKHGGRTIEELRSEVAAKTGENVVIRRFIRFQVGD